MLVQGETLGFFLCVCALTPLCEKARLWIPERRRDLFKVMTACCQNQASSSSSLPSRSVLFSSSHHIAPRCHSGNCNMNNIVGVTASGTSFFLPLHFLLHLSQHLLFTFPPNTVSEPEFFAIYLLWTILNAIYTQAFKYYLCPCVVVPVSKYRSCVFSAPARTFCSRAECQVGSPSYYSSP